MFLKVWCYVLVIVPVIDQTAIVVEIQNGSPRFESQRSDVTHISLEKNSFNFLE